MLDVALVDIFLYDEKIDESLTVFTDKKAWNHIERFFKPKQLYCEAEQCIV